MPSTRCGRVHFEHSRRKWLVITVRPTTSVRKSPRKNLPPRNTPDSFCRLLHPTKSIAMLHGRYFSFTVTCRGEAPPSCLRKTVRLLKSPTGAFIASLRCANANPHLENFISRLNVIPCHDLTLSVSEPDNAAAQTGAGTSFGANGNLITRAESPLLIFCVLTIRKHLLKMRFERSGGGQEPSRGHKFSILENLAFHWDFTSQTPASFPSDLVGVALVGAKPLHLLSQTAPPLKSPTGAFIAPLRYANAVQPQTLLMVRT